jgi:hypothetical protein
MEIVPAPDAASPRLPLAPRAAARPGWRPVHGVDPLRRSRPFVDLDRPWTLPQLLELDAPLPMPLEG